jgi:transposase
MQQDCLTTFLGIQGFWVTAVEQIAAMPAHSVYRFHLARTKKGYICGECGQDAPGYDHVWQEVQHLTLWQHLSFLRFERHRVNCPRCGVRTEALDFVGIRGPRVTRHLAQLVSELCKVTTNKAVGILEALHKHTVKDIDKQAMGKVQAERSLDGLTVLGADEIAVGKGQNNYWTMISAPEGPRGPELLNIVVGRKERSLKKFWKWFGPERAKLITHAVMDMWEPFRNSFQKHCPGIKIIYDKFHVIQHLLKALNDVRKAELSNALGRFKKTLSGKKFVLLARRAHVRGKAREALNDILAASPKLLKAHLLKESFGRLWDYSYKGCALRFWAAWKAELKWSRLTPYHEFVRLVEDHLDGILVYCDKKVSLGYVERTNLTAKNVIRRAYGYGDKDYMKLKIIQACTPWMAQFRPWTVAHSSVP